MPHIKAQVTFKNINGNPDDVYVNTFHFAGVEADAAEIVQLVWDFYNANAAGQSAPLASHLSPNVSRAATGPLAPTIGLYLIPDAPPYVSGPPFHLTTITLGAAGVGAAQPNELAACLSFYAGLNQPSRRGRIFFGPLNASAVGSDLNGDTRVNSTLMNRLVLAGERLMDDSVLGGTPWGVFGKSGVLGGIKVLRTVTAGWADNAFDIQRRRGSVPTVRSVFS